MGKGKKVAGQGMLKWCQLPPPPGQASVSWGSVTPRTHPYSEQLVLWNAGNCQGWWVFWEMAGLGQGCPFCRRG